jgi:hypothetical protein
MTELRSIAQYTRIGLIVFKVRMVNVIHLLLKVQARFLN